MSGLTPLVLALAGGGAVLFLLGLVLVVSGLLQGCPEGSALLLSGGRTAHPGQDARFRVAMARALRLPAIEVVDTIDVRPLPVDLPLLGPADPPLRLLATVRLPTVGEDTPKAARLLYPLPRAELQRLVERVLGAAARIVAGQGPIAEQLEQAAMAIHGVAELDQLGLICDDLRLVR